MYLNRDGDNFVAPFACYRLEDKFQPFFRRYSATMPGVVDQRQLRKFNTSMCHDGRQFTLFRDVDRIRLTKAIIKRHINVEALVRLRAV